MANEINVTSFEHTKLKQSLIAFLQSTGKFDDFDFEGSAINTIIDLLVRNSQYDAFLANMVANESFIESAQIRGNVVSHAEKLSYQPRSYTAARLDCTIEVFPSDLDNLPTSIVLERGTPFIANVAGDVYTFTNLDSRVLTYSSSAQAFRATEVRLFQGQVITNRFVHRQNTKIEIPNGQIDTSTLQVTVIEEDGNGGASRTYNKADAIDDLDSSNAVFFLSENVQGKYEISFGRNLLGVEPTDESIVQVTYIATEDEHANGVQSLFAASPIVDFANVQIEVTNKSYGGDDKEDIERIRFIAPKYYQSQGRALTDRDYIPLLKAGFPFIKSAISWGGETNVPAEYGTVFISIISEEEGELVTNAVKQEMVNFLSDRNVGSITPRIVDPMIFGADLSVKFAYDNRRTTKTFNELSQEIVELVRDYNESIYDFDEFFNRSKLIFLIKSIPAITTVDIDKRIFVDLNVLRFANPVYEVRFGNAIEPGAVWMEGFTVNVQGNNHRLFDQDGRVLVAYEDQQGITQTADVGSVDYEEGVVEFIINMIQEENEVRLYVETQEENFYVQQNRVVFINNIDTELVRIKNRSLNGVI